MPPKTIYRTILLLFIFISLHAFGQEFKPVFDHNILNEYRTQGQLDKAENYLIYSIERVLRETDDEYSIKLVLPYIYLGRIYVEKQNYQEAIRYFKKSLDVMDNSAGSMYPDYCLATNFLVGTYLIIGEEDKAEILLRTINTLHKKTVGYDNPIYSMTLFNEGFLHGLNGDIVLSDKKFKQSLSMMKDYKIEQDFYLNFTSYQIYWAKMMLQQGRFNKAETLLATIKKDLEKNELQNTSQYLLMLTVLGDCYAKTEDFEKAIEVYKQAKERAIHVLGKNQILYANILSLMATVNKKMSQYQLATENLKEALQIYSLRNYHQSAYKRAQLELVNVYLIIGEYEIASFHMRDVSKYIKKSGDIYLFYLVTKARQEFLNGNFVQHEILLSEFYNLMDNRMEKYHDEYTISVSIYVDYNFLYGNPVDGREKLFENYRYLVSTGKTHTTAYSIYQYNLAWNLVEKGDYKQAEESFKQAEKIISKKFSQDHAFMLMVFGLKGWSLSKQEKYREAINYYDKAIKIAKENYLSDTEVHVVRLKFLKAKALVQLKKYEEAKSIFNAILYRCDENTVIYASLLAHLAYLSSIKGDDEQMISYMKQALQNRLSFYQKTLLYSNEQERVLFLKRTNDVGDIFNAIIYDKGETITPEILNLYINFNIANKTILKYRSKISKKKLIALEKIKGEGAIFPYLEKLIQLRSQLSCLYFMSDEERIQQREHPIELKQRVVELEKSLLLASSELEINDEESQIKNWHDIQNKLEESESFVEVIKVYDYNKKDVEYFATILIKNKSYPFLVRIGEEEDLLQLIEKSEDWYKETERQSRGIRINKPTGEKAYASLWKPIQVKLDSLLPNHSTILFCPYGIYNKVNINTFQNPVTKKFLIQEEEIILMSTALELGDFKRENTFSKDDYAVLLGAPVFNNTSNNDDERGAPALKGVGNIQVPITNLPGTEKEIKKIDEILVNKGWETEVYLNKKATEKNIKQLKRSPYILHVATHGFFLQSENVVTDYNLLRSGLFLSESSNLNDSLTLDYSEGIDGILSAFEVTGLNLDKTELVVLSACNTGVVSNEDDDGITSLQYAFSVAGAHTFITSLWNVDDIFTVKLMSKFYELWLLYGDKYKAFRDAQLQLLSEEPDPYYWGSFIMIE